MIGKVYINGVIGVDTSLTDVIKQVKAQSEATEYLVKIDSVGGYVHIGYDIYNYLKRLDKPVTTFATKAYSIASVIFMAGSTRIVEENNPNPLMIHLPHSKAEGDYKSMSMQINQLKLIQDEMVDFYSQAIDLDAETIHSLLEKTTYLDAEQAKELGFATEIQPAQLAVALFKNNDDNKEKNLMNKLEKQVNAMYEFMFGKKSEIKAELVLQDATGLSITFPTLSASDLPAVEDKATVDGKPADGEFTMPDSTVLKFTSGAVAEIVPPTEVENQDDAQDAQDAEGETEGDAPTEDKDATIAELEAKVAELQAKLDEMLTEAQAENILNMLQATIDKSSDLEAKYTALAKQVGSDFQPTTNENKTSVKASDLSQSRAFQIMNSKF